MITQLYTAAIDGSKYLVGWKLLSEKGEPDGEKWQVQHVDPIDVTDKAGKPQYIVERESDGNLSIVHRPQAPTAEEQDAKRSAAIETALRRAVTTRDIIEALIELRAGKTAKVDAIETVYKNATTEESRS